MTSVIVPSMAAAFLPANTVSWAETLCRPCCRVAQRLQSPSSMPAVREMIDEVESILESL